jgi:hypothetical protein
MIKTFEEFNFNFFKKKTNLIMDNPHLEIDPYGEEDWEDIDYNEKFKEFLLRNNAFESFVRNSNLPWSYNNFNVKPEKKELFFTGSFIFEYTPEGYEYWKKLNDKWIKGY